MMTAMDGPTLSTWTPQDLREPRVRVGVVLPADRMHAIRMVLPAAPCRILLDGREVGATVAGEAEVRADEAGVILEGAKGRIGPGTVLALEPARHRRLRHGEGVELRGLITGRGFHWQKRVALTLPGALEFHPADEGLLVVNVLPLEDYLACVLTSEMSGACPLEFLKSQVLVARSWVLVHSEDKHPGLPIDRCNDDCCQRYQGTSFLTDSAVLAVAGTRGRVICHSGGGILDANYSKSCGGVIEAPEFLWGAPKPGQRAAVDAPPAAPEHRFLPVTEANLAEYLAGDWIRRSEVYCSPSVVPEETLPRYLGGVDEGGAYFRWKLRHRREDLERLLRKKVLARRPHGQAPLERLTALRPLRRGRSGRVIELEVGYLDPQGRPAVLVIHDQYHIRDALHEKFLFSSAFAVEAEPDGRGGVAAFTLTGAGWGHGAGLCQIGALGMALRGHDAEAIIHHYFDGVVMRACYP
ncbi:MAG: SpoIID/LytB domain-containing protein [Phycisphaerae bacterium]|jgi:SpoIID/LytB domain protein